MTALLLHQNMLNYGGSDRAGGGFRNALYNLGFYYIGIATGHNYWAAGFTEIRNAATATNFLDRAAYLDPGLTDGILIECGTSLGGRAEYVAIAWDPTVFTVEHYGRVLRQSFARGGSWAIFDEAVGGGVVPGVLYKPDIAYLAAQLRGVAYIAGVDGAGDRHVFGFQHNIFTDGDRSTGFSALEQTLKLTRQLAGYGNALVYIGGDFNVSPHDPGTATRGGLTYVAARNAMGVIRTTAANAYDFWVTNDDNVTDADAGVRESLRNLRVSDHAAITLSLSA